MAAPLEYTPPVADTSESPREALDRLLAVLHETGTLRALEGLFGRFSAVSAVALTELSTPEGRTLISNVLILLRALGRIDPDALENVLGGLERGLSAADDRLDADAPGLLSLAGALRDADVRRGLGAGLAFLHALGSPPKASP